MPSKSNVLNRDSEQQLSFKRLLGFNQLNTVCEAADNPDLLEDIGRLSNKIGEINIASRINSVSH